MKTITINVTCTYDVEITREVSDEVHAQLCDIYDNGGSISDSEIRDGKAMDWLADNVDERDALNWEYEINDLSEKE
ncbi:MAG: hypothetical protein HDR38_08180 [Treponema sp.]|nr:hypothetical protein [Bacteroides sp.]MBD5427505.1 hypothetical protein [Treponema sp.]